MWRISSVLWRVFSILGDNISTVEGIQYTGERTLISACLAINNDDKILFFVLRYEIFIRKFRKFQQISCLWELDWCTTGLILFRNNWILFSECSISLLNLIVFVTARDTDGFLTLSSRLQIHENATEIAWNLKQGFKGAKYPIVFGS